MARRGLKKSSQVMWTNDGYVSILYANHIVELCLTETDSLKWVWIKVIKFENSAKKASYK